MRSTLHRFKCSERRKPEFPLVSSYRGYFIFAVRVPFRLISCNIGNVHMEDQNPKQSPLPEQVRLGPRLSQPRTLQPWQFLQQYCRYCASSGSVTAFALVSGRTSLRDEPFFCVLGEAAAPALQTTPARYDDDGGDSRDKAPALRSSGDAARSVSYKEALGRGPK